MNEYRPFTHLISENVNSVEKYVLIQKLFPHSVPSNNPKGGKKGSWNHENFIATGFSDSSPQPKSNGVTVVTVGNNINVSHHPEKQETLAGHLPKELADTNGGEVDFVFH